MSALVSMALLILLGYPSLSSFLRDREIRLTAESVANGVRLARSEAVRRNLPVSFTFVGQAGSASWTVDQVRDNSQIQTYSRQEGGSNTAVAVQPARASSVVFNGLGRIALAGIGAPPNLQLIDIASALDPNARALRVYVDDARGVRLCDPSPSLATLVPPDPRAC